MQAHNLHIGDIILFRKRFNIFSITSWKCLFLSCYYDYLAIVSMCEETGNLCINHISPNSISQLPENSILNKNIKILRPAFHFKESSFIDRANTGLKDDNCKCSEQILNYLSQVTNDKYAQYAAWSFGSIIQITDKQVFNTVFNGIYHE